jgi:hypothetical protein
MPSGPEYADAITALRNEIHTDVAQLPDPAKQKRKFPKKGLEAFLKKKKVTKLLPQAVPEEITNLVNSTEKLAVIPSEVLRQFLTEHEAWDLVPDNL